MKIILLISFLTVIFLSANNVDALQEVAGKVNIDLKPGQTKSFHWGIISDSNQTTMLNLSASGNGSEFLSYPKTITLSPNQLQNIQVNVTIPSTHGSVQTLTPFLTATEPGKTGGPTIINVQVIKIVTINIQPSVVPEFGSLVGITFAISIIVTVFIIQIKNRSFRLNT